METQNIEVSITISKDSNDCVSLSLVDSASRIEFVDVKFSLESFARALMGQGWIKSDSCEIRGLDKVSKTKVVEARCVEVPHIGYDRETYVQWLKDNAQEEGWIIDTYLGSQSSITHTNGKATLNYHVIKYI